MPSRRLTIVAVSLALLATANTSRAGDDAPKPAASGNEASERFRAGVGFYKDGDFAAALVEFKRAYELDPNYRVLFNLGQTSQELNDYASALSAFEQYLAEGGKEIDAARKKKVEAWIETLNKKVGRITIETNVEGAEVLLDDAPVGTTPLDKPILVNAGRRKFSASMSGYTPVVRTLEIAGLDTSTVKLELVKIETDKPPPPPPPPPPAPAPEPGPNIAAWVALSATGASAVVAGVMGGLAVSARGDLDDALGTYPGNPGAISSAQDKVQTFALVSDIMTGIAVAGAVTTVVLFVVDPGGSSAPDDPPAESAPSARVEISPTGLVVRGTF